MDSFRPLVRFAGFEGEWKKVRLGDMFDIGNGYTPSKNVPQFWTNGTIPWFRMEDIRENGRILKDSIQHVTKEAVKSTGLFPANSIIISTTATIGEHALLIADSLANQRFSFLVRKLNRIDSMDIMFIFYHCFLLGDWCRSKSNAGGLLAVNMEDLRNYYFSLPSLPEQQKISEYFTEIDRAISLQTRKLSKLKQIKAASLQNMFPHEGHNVPAIRFQGFRGEWKCVKLNSFAKRITRKNANLESTLALTIASAHGLVSQMDYFNNLVVGSNIYNYYLIKKGEFAYNKSSSSGYPFGSVKRLDFYEKGILSTLYIVFDIDETVSSDYVVHYFDSSLWHSEIAKVATEGARNHGLLNIGAEDFLNIHISLPSLPEQQAIANYFTQLDRQITLQTQKLAKLKQIKSACLSKMFV